MSEWIEDEGSRTLVEDEYELIVYDHDYEKDPRRRGAEYESVHA